MRRFGRALATAALAVAVVAGTAGWAAGDSVQAAVTGPPPGASAWRADSASGRPLPEPATASAYEVARFLAALDEAGRRGPVRRHPLVVGNLDGAPVALRYEANRLAVAASGRARFASLAAPGRQVLAFDPRGRGQVAEVLGDLERAAHVAVVLPGSDDDAASYGAGRAPHTGPAGMARSLHAAAGGETAVVAGTGYTTPVGVGLDAATGRLAEAGAVRLARFTAGLDAVRIADVPNVAFAGRGHGADPTSRAFGARTVPASDVQGHTGYFVPGTRSLAAFAAIAKGEAQ
ncbi:alpha/beta hydrolase [Streptomyces sp. NPDC059650]|uniref:alpha/beta hydrolase n=1 Tax=Streptomyces sp. NPDC059650 TaxID=3346896 RepID=UPI0036A27846